MAYNTNTDYSLNPSSRLPQEQQAPYPGRPAVTSLGGSFNPSYGFVGQAPAAQMIPGHGQIQYSSMPNGYPMGGPISGIHASSDASTMNTPITSSSNRDSQIGETQDQHPTEEPVNRFGREACDVPPPLMFNYPARVDPIPSNEPRNIPIPTDHSLVLALSDHDKAQVDSDYMGFLIVMERIWPSFLCDHLEGFCRQNGPTLFRKELIEMEVRRVMRLWTSKTVVMKQFPYQILEARDVAHVEYERRVRCWHVEQHLEEYQASAVLRLRQLGYLIGR
ncbi:MAG: hypothetical protein Q9178_000198 [Gyalolechia marmorata]